MTTHLLLTLFVGLLIGLLACNNQPPQTHPEEAALTPAEEQAYREQGQAVAAATFAALSTQLQRALAEGGVPHALTYCNTVALPLTDSVARASGVEVRRTSLQVRNPKNRPTAEEQAVLEAYAAREEAGEELHPVVQLSDGQQFVSFYAPIRLMALCQQCHGRVGETLQAEDHALIRQMYPDDAAVGYSEGDLRGMWSIRVPRAAKNQE